MTSDPKNRPIHLLSISPTDVGVALVYLASPLALAERDAILDAVQRELLPEGVPLSWKRDQPADQLKLILFHEYSATSWETVIKSLAPRIGPVYNISQNTEQLLDAATAGDLSGIPLEKLMAYRQRIILALESAAAS